MVMNVCTSMPRAKRICPKRGCASVADGRYCQAHNREYEADRGSSTQRGYDHRHKALRKQWDVKVQRGGVLCASCGKPIHPGTPWDLGHTDDRADYKGPEHPACNRSDGGKRAHPSLET